MGGFGCNIGSVAIYHLGREKGVCLLVALEGYGMNYWGNPCLGTLCWVSVSFNLPPPHTHALQDTLTPCYMEKDLILTPCSPKDMLGFSGGS